MPRRLGQHFLADIAILDRIVDALDPAPDDLVLEIGPGQGTLTSRLLSRVGRVVAIEKDRELVSELRARLRAGAAEWPLQGPPTGGARRTVQGAGGQGAGSREQGAGGRGVLTVVEGDALEIDWHEALRRTTHDARRTVFKVVGNIPYYITSPLIEKALTPPFPSRIVFLVQREVADRLAAAPGSKTYGALSIGVQTAANVERLFVVRAGAFRPPPKVDSAVVRLIPKPEPEITDAERAPFRAFVTAVFSRRRKQIVNALGAVPSVTTEHARHALDAVGITPTARPETVAPETFVALFHTLER